jgi:hypothetical protein
MNLETLIKSAESNLDIVAAKQDNLMMVLMLLLEYRGVNVKWVDVRGEELSIGKRYIVRKGMNPHTKQPYCGLYRWTCNGWELVFGEHIPNTPTPDFVEVLVKGKS